MLRRKGLQCKSSRGFEVADDAWVLMFRTLGTEGCFLFISLDAGGASKR